MIREKLLPLFFVIVFLFSACSLLPNNNAAPAPDGVETAVFTQLNVTAQPDVTPSGATPTTITQTMRTLRVWVPPELMVTTEDGSSVLRTQIEAYERTQSELDIILEPKVVAGQGGILSYLRSGRNIAPSILPDLIVLPSEQVTAVFTDNLIVSLDTLITPEQLEQLYPAAQTMARPGESVLGHPFAITNLTHFAYDSETISDPISSTWGELAEDEFARFALPLETHAGAIFVLQLYLDAGGSLVNEAGQPALELVPLILALRSINEARLNGVVNASLSQGNSVQSLWDGYSTRQINAVLTTSQSYLQQEDVDNLAISPVAGVNDGLTPFVSGWSWAISTGNSNQQLLARDLMLYLTQPEILSVWSEQNQILPAHPDALALWSREDSYVSFLQGQLLTAEAVPQTATADILSLLQEAALQVISGEASPQAAAETAVSAMQP